MKFEPMFQNLKNEKNAIFIFQKNNFLNYTFHTRIIKLIGFSIFKITEHRNSNLKFVFQFYLKNEKPNLLEQISYEITYQITLRYYNRQDKRIK